MDPFLIKYRFVEIMVCESKMVAYILGTEKSRKFATKRMSKEDDSQRFRFHHAQLHKFKAILHAVSSHNILVGGIDNLHRLI